MSEENNFPVTEKTAAAVQAFAQGGAQNFAPEQAAVQGGFLKFSGKTGLWEMGTEEEDFHGVEVFIDVLQAQHGFLRWGTKPPAKTYSPIHRAKPQAPAPFDGTDMQTGQPKTHYAQASRMLIGETNDEHADVFCFETGSMGGVEKVDELISEVFSRANRTTFIFPIVKLGKEFYTRTTGKVYKPVFEVIRWVDSERNVEGAPVKAIEATPKTRNKTVEKVVEEVVEVEEVAEAEAPVKKRRTRKAS